MCNECHEQQPNVPPYPNMADVDPCNHLPVIEPVTPPATSPDCEPVTVRPVDFVPGSDEDPCRTDWKYGLNGITDTGINPTAPLTPIPVPVPPTTLFRSIALSVSINRNNCLPGFVGTVYVASVPTGAFSSLLSQADANQKAQAYLDSVAQLYANRFGTCVDDTRNNPSITDISWGGELNCQPGPSIGDISWGWQNGQTVIGCSTATQISDVSWGATIQCPTPVTSLSDVAWGEVICN